MQTLVRPVAGSLPSEAHLLTTVYEDSWANLVMLFYVPAIFRLRDGFGTVLGAQGRSDTIVFLLKDNGRWRPRVPDELFGTLLPADRANFGGSPRAQSHMVSTDLGDTRFGRSGR